VQIFFGLKEIENSAQPYALTVILLAAAIGMYVVGKLVLGGKAYAMYSKASRAASEKQLPAWGGAMASGAFGLVTFLAVLPHIGVVLTSVSAWGGGITRWCRRRLRVRTLSRR
jgi:iron(III) transport system permease protein